MRRLDSAAALLQILAVLTLLAGLVGGVILIAYTEEDGFRETSRPFVELGVGVIAAGIVQFAVMSFAAAWANAWVSVNRQRV